MRKRETVDTIKNRETRESEARERMRKRVT